MTKNFHSTYYECCIIGAGPAGLGTALELVNHGVNNIIIIDKNNSVGGLSRTEVYDGVRFDLGPHRFFTKNKQINDIWHHTLGSNFLPVYRLTRIFYHKTYFCYPIKPSDVFIKLGLKESFHTILSFFSSQMNTKTKPVNFEDWVIQHFGRKLYETFFKTYTEKVWGIPCNQIGAEWAAQRIKGLDFLEVLKHGLWGGKSRQIKTLVEEFDYPVLGAGQMYEAMSDRVVSKGATLMLDSSVIRLNRQDNTIKSIDILKLDGHKINIAADQFFSSIPLSHFFKMLNPTDSNQLNHAADMLRYRDHITVNLLVRRENVFPDQWIYVHSPEVHIARITNYNNFSQAMVGRGNKTALSVEYFLFKNKGLWNERDEFLVDLTTHELREMGLIRPDEVENTWVVRETEAYPIYDLGFQEPLRLLKSRIGQFVNCYSIGRGGMHRYNNQDHSLMTGILAARNYLKVEDSPYLLWDINIDAEYHENTQRAD